MSFSYSTERLFNYLAVRGVKVLDENLDLVLDKDPRAKKVLQDFVDLFKEELVPAPEWIAQQSDINDFLGGITAVHWSGSWMCRSIIDIMKQTGKRFAPAYVPKDVDWFGINGGHIFGVVRTGDKKREEEAIKFALWIGQKGLGNDVFNKALLGISPFKDHKIDVRCTGNERVDTGLSDFDRKGTFLDSSGQNLRTLGKTLRSFENTDRHGNR